MSWEPDYATAAELAEYMRIPDTLDADTLGRAVTSASRAVDRATLRQFGQVAVAEQRVYPARWDSDTGRWVVSMDDTMTAPTAVGVDEAGDETWGTPVTGYVLRDLNAAARGRPWTALWLAVSGSVVPYAPERYVAVTALWGWSAVPDTIRSATLLQASRFASRRDSPYGIAGTGDQSPALRLQAQADPDVKLMCRPYRRTWAVA